MLMAGGAVSSDKRRFILGSPTDLATATCLSDHGEKKAQEAAPSPSGGQPVDHLKLFTPPPIATTGMSQSTEAANPVTSPAPDTTAAAASATANAVAVQFQVQVRKLVIKSANLLKEYNHVVEAKRQRERDRREAHRQQLIKEKELRKLLSGDSDIDDNDPNTLTVDGDGDDNGSFDSAEDAELEDMWNDMEEEMHRKPVPLPSATIKNRKDGAIYMTDFTSKKKSSVPPFRNLIADKNAALLAEILLNRQYHIGIDYELGEVVREAFVRNKSFDEESANATDLSQKQQTIPLGVVAPLAAVPNGSMGYSASTVAPTLNASRQHQNVHMIGGLEPDTPYVVTMRVCYSTVSGRWVNPVPFSTDYIPILKILNITQLSASFQFKVLPSSLGTNAINCKEAANAQLLVEAEGTQLATQLIRRNTSTLDTQLETQRRDITMGYGPFLDGNTRHHVYPFSIIPPARRDRLYEVAIVEGEFIQGVTDKDPSRMLGRSSMVLSRSQKRLSGSSKSFSKSKVSYGSVSGELSSSTILGHSRLKSSRISKAKEFASSKPAKRDDPQSDDAYASQLSDDATVVKSFRSPRSRKAGADAVPDPDEMRPTDPSHINAAKKACRHKKLRFLKGRGAEGSDMEDEDGGAPPPVPIPKSSNRANSPQSGSDLDPSAPPPLRSISGVPANKRGTVTIDTSRTGLSMGKGKSASSPVTLRPRAFSGHAMSIFNFSANGRRDFARALSRTGTSAVGGSSSSAGMPGYYDGSADDEDGEDTNEHVLTSQFIIREGADGQCEIRLWGLKRDRNYTLVIREVINGKYLGAFKPLMAFWTQPYAPIITELMECKEGVCTVKWGAMSMESVGLILSGSSAPTDLVFSVERGLREDLSSFPLRGAQWEQVAVTDQPQLRYRFANPAQLLEDAQTGADPVARQLLSTILLNQPQLKLNNAEEVLLQQKWENRRGKRTVAHSPTSPTSDIGAAPTPSNGATPREAADGHSPASEAYQTNEMEIPSPNSPTHSPKGNNNGDPINAYLEAKQAETSQALCAAYFKRMCFRVRLSKLFVDVEGQASKAPVWGDYSQIAAWDNVKPPSVAESVQIQHVSDKYVAVWWEPPANSYLQPKLRYHIYISRTNPQGELVPITPQYGDTALPSERLQRLKAYAAAASEVKQRMLEKASGTAAIDSGSPLTKALKEAEARDALVGLEESRLFKRHVMSTSGGLAEPYDPDGDASENEMLTVHRAANFSNAVAEAAVDENNLSVLVGDTVRAKWAWVATVKEPKLCPPFASTLAPPKIGGSNLDPAGPTVPPRYHDFIGDGVGRAVILTGLLPSTTYQIKIQCESSFGFGGKSNIITFATRLVPNKDIPAPVVRAAAGGRALHNNAGSLSLGSYDPHSSTGYARTGAESSTLNWLVKGGDASLLLANLRAQQKEQKADDQIVITELNQAQRIKTIELKRMIGSSRAAITDLLKPRGLPPPHVTNAVQSNLYDKYDAPRQKRLQTLASLAGTHYQSDNNNNARGKRQAALRKKFTWAAEKAMLILRVLNEDAFRQMMRPTFDSNTEISPTQKARHERGQPENGDLVWSAEHFLSFNINKSFLGPEIQSLNAWVASRGFNELHINNPSMNPLQASALLSSRQHSPSMSFSQSQGHRRHNNQQPLSRHTSMATSGKPLDTAEGSIRSQKTARSLEADSPKKVLQPLSTALVVATVPEPSTPIRQGSLMRLALTPPPTSASSPLSIPITRVARTPQPQSHKTFSTSMKPNPLAMSLTALTDSPTPGTIEKTKEPPRRTSLSYHMASSSPLPSIGSHRSPSKRGKQQVPTGLTTTAREAWADPSVAAGPQRTPTTSSRTQQALPMLSVSSRSLGSSSATPVATRPPKGADSAPITLPPDYIAMLKDLEE
eukprot:GILI01004348.1.p1 GENE.GILI01004348.1~~GILI01004348.1.p1  ORF type:complete len:2017 (+),score=477.76 GILI01004348.1:389-6052(+)